MFIHNLNSPAIDEKCFSKVEILQAENVELKAILCILDSCCLLEAVMEESTSTAYVSRQRSSAELLLLPIQPAFYI